MIRYAIRRILWGIVVLGVILTVTFVLFGPVLQGAKGTSAAQVLCGPRCTPEKVAATEAFLGLNDPWYVQMGTYVRRIVLGPSDEDLEKGCPKRNGEFEDCTEYVGRLGQSFILDKSVDRIIVEGITKTLSLALFAAFLWMLISIPIGILSALRRGSLFDRVTMVAVLWGQALPVYYFGLLALYFLAYLPNSDTMIDLVGVRFEIFPIGGYEEFELSNPWPWAHHLILPAATLALQFAALYVRMIRSNMLGVMSEDYIRTARAKGVPPRGVVMTHGFRNAMLPIVTMLGLDIGILVGGAVLTEYTFGIEGLGRWAVRGATTLDVPVTSGIVLVAAAAVVIMNIIVDLAYAFIDPRVRLS